MKKQQDSSANFYEIPLTLAGRNYPVMVTPQEEPTIREICQQLNARVDLLQNKYGSRLTKQDILAMLLLTHAKDLHELQQSTHNAPNNASPNADSLAPLLLLLENMEQQIDEAISEG